jgi:hypothetical protein
VITKAEQHDVNRAGKRLLRDVLEPLDWVVNDVQEDYGIDCNIQVFDGSSPTGAWFHVQLKSSASSDYAADGTFVSQELSIDHARHYALELHQPVVVIHADVTSKCVYWYTPQLDGQLATVLAKEATKSVTVRIPTCQQLPRTAPDLLLRLDKIHLALANRELASVSTRAFAESLKHLPNQDTFYRAFQEKNDTLKLRRIGELFEQGKFDQARARAKVLLEDPESTVEIKFWAQINLRSIDCSESVHAGRPQNELPRLLLGHAKSLQKLTAEGPKHLKFYSLIERRSAELDILFHENFSLFMALQQHLQRYTNPTMALGLYARRSACTRRIISKYNQCVRLARYASNYSDRWVLGRALPTIVSAIGRYLVTLRSENELEAERTFAQSALQICKLAVWICDEAGDPEGVVLAIMNALLTTDSTDSDAYRWASQVAQGLADQEIRADALLRIERAVKRWKGEPVLGDYQGDTVWQAIQNMATALGIDVNDVHDPLVRGLRIAAKDNSPERVLAECEHLLVSQGAIGPTARRIQDLFNIDTAGSKVVHCTLHHYHVEGDQLDTAYGEFKRAHCDSCPDQQPRPEGWRFTYEVRQTIEARHREFVARLAGTPYGIRYTDKD